MKPHLFRIILFMALAMFFYGCKCDGVGGLFSKKYDSYQEAVQDGNFKAAHKILNNYREKYHDLMSQSADSRRAMKKLKEKRRLAEDDFYQAFDYIYKNEIVMIMDSFDGQEAVDRIVDLLGDIPFEGNKVPEGTSKYDVDEDQVNAYMVWTQHFNKLCDNTLTMAINKRNRLVAQQIPFHFVDNVLMELSDYKYVRNDAIAALNKYRDAEGLFPAEIKNSYDGYSAAVEAGNFDEAYSYLKNYHDKLVSAISRCANEPIPKEQREQYNTALLAYFDAFDYVYKAEIRMILSTMDGQDASDKITFLLSEIPVDGTKYSKGDYNNVNSTDNGCVEYYTFYNTYNTWAQHFNGLCDTALMLAINRKNKVAAQQVLLYYADNVTVTHRYSTDNIDYTRTDAHEAQKKYEDAEAMGMFK